MIPALWVEEVHAVEREEPVAVIRWKTELEQESGKAMSKATTIETDVVLGEQYRDTATGITGRVISQHFYEYGCERVVLEWTKDGEIKTESFDAPRLVRESTNQPVTTDRTGGPDRGGERRPSPPARP